MKKAVIAFCLLTMSSSAFAKSPEFNLCRQSAVEFVDKVLGLQDLTIADTILVLKDANEKSVSLLSVDNQTGDETYRIVYAAVNREVGINMEGEWELIADVTTARNPNEGGGCDVSGSTLKTRLPK